MEDVRSSRKERRKKNRKPKTKVLKVGQKMHLKNKGVRKSMCGERNSQKAEEKALKRLNRERNCCSEKHSEHCTEWRSWRGNHSEQIVDLCENDSLVENSSVVIVSTLDVEPQNECLVEVRESLPEDGEVIDLTESISRSQDVHVLKRNCMPTVIDLSDDDSVEKRRLKVDNDEVFVIGEFNKSCSFNKKFDNSCSHLKSKKSFNNLTRCSRKLQRKYLKKSSVFDKIFNKTTNQSGSNFPKPGQTSSETTVSKIGENIYINSPVTLPSAGLRPIIIDGSNVAFVHSSSNFSCKRLEICINYFKEKGHKVTAFVPQYRINSNKSDDPHLLRKLERQGDVVLTPSKRIDGKNIVPYDDRFIVQTAVLKGGVIVTRDNYNDLLKENPAWAETIKYRTLAFIWVDDTLMFPKDPLGEHGPTLEEFLRFH